MPCQGDSHAFETPRSTCPAEAKRQAEAEARAIEERENITLAQVWGKYLPVAQANKAAHTAYAEEAAYRLDFGPGYRIYLGLDGQTVVVLLCGGDKSSQGKDIKRARSLWQAYRREKHESRP